MADAGEVRLSPCPCRIKEDLLVCTFTPELRFLSDHAGGLVEGPRGPMHRAFLSALTRDARACDWVQMRGAVLNASAAAAAWNETAALPGAGLAAAAPLAKPPMANATGAAPAEAPRPADSSAAQVEGRLCVSMAVLAGALAVLASERGADGPSCG